MREPSQAGDQISQLLPMALFSEGQWGPQNGLPQIPGPERLGDFDLLLLSLTALILN